MNCTNCEQPITGHGNNGAPLFDGEVCDNCNSLVIAARMQDAGLTLPQAPGRINQDDYIQNRLQQIMAAAAAKDTDTLEAIIDRIYLDGFQDGEGSES